LPEFDLDARDRDRLVNLLAEDKGWPLLLTKNPVPTRIQLDLRIKEHLSSLQDITRGGHHGFPLTESKF
jgi:hypothetical protein